MIREMTDRSQFILITHIKKTMQLADVLYGVTMGPDGVSQVVSRRLPQHERQHEAPDKARVGRDVAEIDRRPDRARRGPRQVRVEGVARPGAA